MSAPLIVRTFIRPAPLVLRALLAHSNPVVRSWVSYAAPSILGAAAIPLLEVLVNDADDSVQTEGMDALVSLDASYLERFVPRYFAAARTSDWPAALYGILRLTRYRIPGSAELFQELMRSAEMPAIRNHARVMLLVLNGSEDEVLTGLSGDDHALMSVWVKGAVYLHTKRSLDALREVSQRDPHPDCRRYAAHALSVKDDVGPIGRN